MVWVRLDDQFNTCNKIKFVGRDARDLFLAMIFHCNRRLTDGFIAEHFVPQLAMDAEINVTPKHIKICVQKLLTVAPMEANPLLHKVENGYQIHDYKNYQPSRKDVMAGREDLSEIRRENGSKGADARWGPVGPDGKRHGKTMANVWQNDSKNDGKRDSNHSKTDGDWITPNPESRNPENAYDNTVTTPDSLGSKGEFINPHPSFGIGINSSASREGSMPMPEETPVLRPLSQLREQAVEAIVKITGSPGSRNRFRQLYEKCDRHGLLLQVWEHAKRKTIEKLKAEQCPNPGGYFCTIIVDVLRDDYGIVVDIGSAAEREEIKGLMQASLNGADSDPDPQSQSP